MVTPYREPAAGPPVDSTRRRTPGEVIADIEEAARRGVTFDLVVTALSAALAVTILYFVWTVL